MTPPPLRIEFEPARHYEVVRIEGAPRGAPLIFDLRPVPEGEYRELTRMGFRSTCVARTAAARSAHRAAEAHLLIERIIRNTYASLEGSPTE